MLASSAAAEETCPNAELRVGPSAGLPDCRAYEQVTPVEKQGGSLEQLVIGQGAEGAPDVVATSFATLPGLRDNEGVSGGDYSLVRTSTGWTTSAMPPPATEYNSSTYGLTVGVPLAATSLDARSGLWYERRKGWPENRVDIIRTQPSGAIEDVGPMTPPSTPPGSVNEDINSTDALGWSADLSHILINQSSFPPYEQTEGFRFWPFDPTKEGEGSRKTLYEYIGSGNTQPMLVGLGNDDKLISDCGTDLGGIELRTIHSRYNAVSADGSVVFFTAHECGTAVPVDELFARIDNGQPDAHTVAISEPSAADCSQCDTTPGVLAAGDFEGASVDGSRVFFETEQPLLGGDSTLNIYEYDFEAPAGERVTRVSSGDATAPNATAEVQGIVASSQDGSHVYFVAHGVLTEIPNSQGQLAQAGGNNLYVYERDAQYPSGHTAFIANLSEEDRALWLSIFSTKEPAPGTVRDYADLTPNGRFLVFTSLTDHLTPDDTSTAAQAFEYDAQTASLVRVSIGQNGYNDNGNSDVAVAGAQLPHRDLGSASDQTKYLRGLAVSANGSYVFFQSADGLTPQALNDEPIGEKQEPADEEKKLNIEYAANIYEYHDGNVYLISDGRDVTVEASEETDVQLIGTDESGDDVLFTAGDQLVPQDIDTNLDIYDARVDGGFAPPVIKPECSSDGCQGPLASAPTLLSPGSEFQAGGENVAPAEAPVAKQVKQKPKKKPKRAKRKVKVGKRGRKARLAAAGHRRLHGKRGRS